MYEYLLFEVERAEMFRAFGFNVVVFLRFEDIVVDFWMFLCKIVEVYIVYMFLDLFLFVYYFLKCDVIGVDVANVGAFAS